MSERASDLECRYFQLERLANGVYAGIANRDEGTIANVGIIDLGGAALVVDSFMLPQAAHELLWAVDHLIGKPVTVLVNTHAHDDHFVGNCVFPAETSVISTQRNRELMVEWGKESAEEVRELIEYVADLWRQLPEAQNEAERRRLGQTITRFERFVEAFPEVVLRPPDLTFEERLTIHGSRRRAEVLACGAAHSLSDVVVHLPEEGIVFAGDLVFAESKPYLFDCDPEGWRAALARLEALEFETLVPGHGPVGTRAAAADVREYLAVVEGLVRQVIAEGGTVDDASNVAVPARYEGWGSQALAEDMRFLFERLSRADGGRRKGG